MASKAHKSQGGAFTTTGDESVVSLFTRRIRSDAFAALKRFLEMREYCHAGFFNRRSDGGGGAGVWFQSMIPAFTLSEPLRSSYLAGNLMLSSIAQGFCDKPS